jgi:hypothetical protein
MSRLRKRAAAGVAQLAVETYETLTGRKATIITDPVSHKARGPVLKFIGELFAVLNIDSSPESQLRKAIEARAKQTKERRSALKAD